MSYRIVDEAADALGWVREEKIERASHALAVDGRVWLVDPLDEPELADRVRALGEPAGVLQLLDRHRRGCAAWANRFGIPVIRAWEGVGDAPFEVLPVLAWRWWHEVALWEPGSRTLVCADALGTVPFFRASEDEPLGVHPLLRLVPPRRLVTVEPERVLVGHGAGVHENAADAVHRAVRTARRRLPAAWWRAARLSRRR